MVRNADIMNRGPRMMTGRMVVDDDMKYRRMMTAAMVVRRLIKETHLDRVRWVGERILQQTGPMVRYEKIPLKRNTGNDERMVKNCVLKVKMRTVTVGRSGGRMKRMTQDARGTQ